MKKTNWSSFFEEKIKYIFLNSKEVIDIGGTLRVDSSRQNRTVLHSRAWLMPYLQNTSYKIMDKVSDYNPDIVGDIHAMPFPDNSVDAIICMAVLEHVEDPKKAVEEIYRVLKPGGFAYFYAPFLFYYHAENGYFGDFYRYTHDGMKFLTRQFTTVEIVSVRGPLTTVLNLIPYFSKKEMRLAQWFDRKFKPNSPQVSGHEVFCVK